MLCYNIHYGLGRLLLLLKARSVATSTPSNRGRRWRRWRRQCCCKHAAAARCWQLDSDCRMLKKDYPSYACLPARMRRMLILARSFSFLIFTLHISITEVLPSFATALRRVTGCTVVTVQCRIFFCNPRSYCNMKLKSMSYFINVASRKSHFKRLLSFFHEQLQ